MTGPCRWFVKNCLLTAVLAVFLPISTLGQEEVAPEPPPEIYFSAIPQTQLLAKGEPVTLVLELNNGSEKPAFVSGLNRDELLDFKVIGPDGKDVPWQGKLPIGPSEYSPSDFEMLEPHALISAKRIISLQDGVGFDFNKPGQYTVTAEHSQGAADDFAPVGGDAIIPAGPFPAPKSVFCIEVCVAGPLPGPVQEQTDGTPAALEAVRVFYDAIVQYHPLGIPSPKEVFWPLVSKRLADELDSVQSCNDDYYRRYGDFLRENVYKPSSIWLEDGPFTGPNDAADPASFSILSSRAIGENRVDVHLKFTSQGEQPDDSFDFEGVATVIRENDRWLIDDFVTMYGNDNLGRLSDDIPECKNGMWVGDHP